MTSGAFDGSSMAVRTEKASETSKEYNNKKRKLALMDSIEQLQSLLIPDTSVLFGTQEFACVEVAKTKNDIKELVEGGKKCSEMMSQVFEQLLSLHPTERRSIEVHSLLLSKLNCTPLEMSSLSDYVKLVKRGKTVQHPEMPQSFKAQMMKLLAQVWQFRLATEMVVEAMIASDNVNNEFID
ncbi:hypothetical protein MAM1_0088c04816 [Mucor ambiguus]|uniref:Uncharacterized protein n=1 Tax=Mucor ambiguus TaxID=91626 RepID=A0A0C9M6D2_9FUNG|nr:hypothetical protein MAM1_0088c04816 [Mucor ambiguus]